MSDITIAGTLHVLIYFSSTYIVQALATESIENCFLQACYVGIVHFFQLSYAVSKS